MLEITVTNLVSSCAMRFSGVVREVEGFYFLSNPNGTSIMSKTKLRNACAEKKIIKTF